MSQRRGGVEDGEAGAATVAGDRQATGGGSVPAAAAGVGSVVGSSDIESAAA